MKNKLYTRFYILILSSLFVFSNCTDTHKISFKDTLSIFLFNNGKNYFLCIPVQYIGDYQISDFNFFDGSVVMGNYEIQLINEELIIYTYYFAKNETDYEMNQYDIFIERHLTNDELKNIIKQYKEGNIHSHFSIWYDIVIDNEKQTGNGILDEFELYNEFAQDAIWYLPHFQNFRDKYFNHNE